MATKIGLNDVKDNLNEFSLDFYFFTIKGKAEPAAKDVFQAIMEMEKFNYNPYERIVASMDKEYKDKYDEIVANRDEKLSKLKPEQKEAINIVMQEAIADLDVLVNRYMLENNLPPVESFGGRLVEAVSNGKAVAINRLFVDIMRQSAKNKSFTAEANKEAEGYDKLSGDEIKALIEKMGGCENLNEMANSVFEAYKEKFSLIYGALILSVIAFLEPLK